MRLIAAVAICVMCFVGIVSAQSSHTATQSGTTVQQNDIDRSRAVVIGVEDVSYFPHYRFDHEELYGFSREIFDAFSEDRNLAVVYKPLPVGRLVVEMVNGNIDLLYPDNSAWSRAAKGNAHITYSNGVVRFVSGVLVRPERWGKGIDALKLLGTVVKFTPWGYTDLIEQGKIELTGNRNIHGLVLQGLHARVDGIYANPVVIDHVLHEHIKMPGGLVFDKGLPHVEGYYYLSTTTRPDLITDFNQWMTENAARVATMKARFGLPTD